MQSFEGLFEQAGKSFKAVHSTKERGRENTQNVLCFAQ